MTAIERARDTRTIEQRSEGGRYSYKGDSVVLHHHGGASTTLTIAEAGGVQR